MGQDNTIYKCLIKLSFSSKEQNKSKLQKQISKIMFYHCMKLPVKLKVFYVFVSVALICFVLYLRKIFLSKICLLHCLVLLNSVLFKRCLFLSTLER